MPKSLTCVSLTVSLLEARAFYPYSYNTGVKLQFNKYCGTSVSSKMANVLCLEMFFLIS